MHTMVSCEAILSKYMCLKPLRKAGRPSVVSGEAVIGGKLFFFVLLIC